jgi:hypothetical protein
VSIGSVSKKLASLVPQNRCSRLPARTGARRQLLTYGVGVSLQDMAKPDASLTQVLVS